MPSERRIEEYVEADGSRPVRDFVQQLTPAEQGRLHKRLQYLQLEGFQAGRDVITNLSGKPGDPRRKLWELRLPKSEHNPRALLFPASGRMLVLLHGFNKSGNANDKIPESEIATALRRMNRYKERHGSK